MDDFLTTLWIEEEVIEIKTPEVKSKKKKKKTPSPEKLERRRLQMEFEEQCRIKREQKAEKIRSIKPISWYACLAKLPSWYYFTAAKKYITSLENRVRKLWWEIIHTWEVQDIILASFTRKNRLKKYRKWSKIYDLPDSEVNRILSLTK